MESRKRSLYNPKCRSVGRSVEKIQNQRYELVHWYFVYKLNKLLWNLGKEAYIIPNVSLIMGPSISRSVHLLKRFYITEMQPCLETFTAGAYSTFALVLTPTNQEK